MSTAEITVTIPDTVRELLTLAGDDPLEIVFEARSRETALGRGATMLTTKSVAGSVTRHRVDIPITDGEGYCDRFWLYVDGELESTNGRFDQGGAKVWLGDTLRLNPVTVRWTA